MPDHPTRPEGLAENVAAQFPQLCRDLATLVAIPSVSAPGYPEETREALLEAYDTVAELFRAAGVHDVRPLELPGTAPVVTGEIPAPEGAPTVLLYAHYDVVGAGDPGTWDSPPFEATERDGAIYGRGAADTKSNLLAHLAALRAWGGRPPVGVKLLIEGQEEVGSVLSDPANLVPFGADAMLIGDSGNIRPGVPCLTVALRGTAVVTVEVRTLAGPQHSGMFGGAAPDALLVLMQALASLHDPQGNVAVRGLRRERWGGTSQSDEEFRELATVEPGLPLFGTGSLGERIWTGPAITVTGIDVPSVNGAVNAVAAHARARLNVRAHPGQSAVEAQAAVIDHLEALRPFGIAVTCEPGETGDGFAARVDGPAYAAAAVAFADAWGSELQHVASGGSIPLVMALSTAHPDAEILLYGATDGFASIHGPNERVLLDELEKTVLAEALFFGEFAARRG